MNCLSREELIDYLFSAGSARGAAGAHLSACAGCRLKLETLERLKAAAASVPPAPVSGDFTARLMRGLKTRPAPGSADMPAFFRRLFNPAWGLGLAAFAVAVYGGMFFLAGPRAPRRAAAEALYFSDGPATVNSGFSATGGVSGGDKAGYVYADSCAAARCGIL